MITIPFEDFFERRRQYNVEVDYVDRGSFYLCQMTLPNTTKLYTEVAKNTAEGNLFEATYQSKCNKTIRPDVPNLLTHDFSNSDSWVSDGLSPGTFNSIFTWTPSPGKKLVLREITTSCWKDMQFATNQAIVFAIWESVTQACPVPTYVTKTDYNNSPYWVKVWPAPYYDGPTEFPAQEVQIFVCVDGIGTPLYKVTEFKYRSVSTITKKARSTRYHLIKKADPVLGDIEEQVSWFPYYDQDIHICLRSSLNERIECFTSDNQELNNSTSNIPSIATAVFHSYDEW